MKILPVFQYNNIPKTYNKAVIRPELTQDSFTFTGGEKKLINKNLDVTNLQAQSVCTGAIQGAKKLNFILKRYLGNYAASTFNPNNPICAGERGIKVRIKSQYSTMEKASSRALRKEKDIKSMGDVIGARIVLRDASQKNVDKILDELSKAAEKGDLKIFEIENYKLPNGKSYASAAALKKLEKACGKTGFVSMTERSIESGYTAIHLGVKLPDGYTGEIQIMGRDVEDLKELEDIVYKLRCNKSLAPKYKSLEKPLRSALGSMSENHKEIYMQYIRDSYTRAREIEPKPLNFRKQQQFLPIPYFLPQELGFGELAKAVERINKTDRL